ncbi:hypothetical protein [Devosia marina]|uniref:Uncharacterized protein n=1 Tax=Devosia marina TaxID=2683198 RepID=A0A7X3FSX3_9HYPH|nr:hypothetical protein [Devosia marina]MVT00183.1 hypothetical protein [Devosia marina]
MPVDLSKALTKLDRPPSSHNWVRFVRSTQPETTRSILSFVRGMPRFTYQTGSSAIRDRLALGIDYETAVAITQRSGAPAGRDQNRGLVDAFFEYDRDRKYPKFASVGFEKQWFRVSREILVPVAPLSVIREHERFVPLFVCGWSQVQLNLSQRRLLATVCEDAFLSLTDYMDSPAEFLFFPKNASGIRESEVWSRGDYDLLPEGELNDQVMLYLAAREEARAILAAEKAAADEAAKDTSEHTDPSAPSLFDK